MFGSPCCQLSLMKIAMISAFPSGLHLLVYNGYSFLLTTRTQVSQCLYPIISNLDNTGELSDPFVQASTQFTHITSLLIHPHPETPLHFPPHTIPLGHPGAPAPSIQYRASNLDWGFVSDMILYIFQCHSPKSSHPLPLPQSPKDYSTHQCLFCCLIYRVIVTIFLNSIYMLSISPKTDLTFNAFQLNTGVQWLQNAEKKLHLNQNFIPY